MCFLLGFECLNVLSCFFAAKELTMCNDPGLPEHGKRTVTSNLVTAVVTFSCDPGYFMVGNNQRTCLPTGQWSGSIPSCERK